MKIFINTPFSQSSPWLNAFVPAGIKNISGDELKNDKVLRDYKISHMSYDSFLKDKRNFSGIAKHGLSGSSLFSHLRNPEYINRLYLQKDKSYYRYLYEFKERYHDYDVIVMNPGVDLVHPEFLHLHFPHALKCLHFIDDPHATYSYGLPFSWAFDCATYVMHGYNNQFHMSELLQLAGFKKSKWFPHCISNIDDPLYDLNDLKDQLLSRNNRVIYIGGYYTGKNERLAMLKHTLKADFDIFGRHPLRGYMMSAVSTLNGRPSIYRVRSLSDSERESSYARYSIGLNLHLSNPEKEIGREIGNSRLYELAYRGVAQVVDASKASLVDMIFEPEKEILVYNSLSECVDQIRRLQSDEELRINIATNAYKRAITEYNYPNRLLDLFDWFKQLL